MIKNKLSLCEKKDLTSKTGRNAKEINRNHKVALKLLCLNKILEAMNRKSLSPSHQKGDSDVISGFFEIFKNDIHSGYQIRSSCVLSISKLLMRTKENKQNNQFQVNLQVRI